VGAVRFTAARDALARAVQQAAQGLPARPLRPVDAGMLIEAEAGEVWFTSGDENMRFTAQADAVIEDQGAAVLPGHLLAETAKLWTGETVTVETGATATVVAGRSRFTLPAGNPREYPQWEGGIPFLADLAGFPVRKVLPFAKRDHPVFRAVQACGDPGKLVLAATDGISMAVVTVPAEGEIAELPALIPAVMMERFARIAEVVSLGWDEGTVTLETEGVRAACRQIHGEFPDWRRLLRRISGDWVTVSAAELTRAVKTAKLAADTITLTFDGNDLHVLAEGFRDYLDTDYPGEQASFLFGADRLLAALAPCGETVQLSFTGPGKPVFFRDEDYVSAVLPRREGA